MSRIYGSVDHGRSFCTKVVIILIEFNQYIFLRKKSFISVVIPKFAIG